MEENQVKFFLPNPKLNKTNQTNNLHNDNKSTYEQLHENALASSYFHQPIPKNQVSQAYLKEYNASIAFFMSNMKNDRFDLLSPPSNLFENYPFGFSVNFFNENFTITGGSKQNTIVLNYKSNIIPIIESLETGKINPELYFTIRRVVDFWGEGRVLCKITDFRFPNELTYFQVLSMTQEVTNLLLAKSKTRSKIDLLEAERQIMLMQHQEICTDPSPNVARSQSIMDWRKKTWRNPNEIQAEKFITQTHQVKPNELSDKIVLHPLKETIHIPDAILRTFSSIS